MTDRCLDRLKELVDGSEWVKGAVNYDEDLHFSSFYLRASWARHTVPLYPGYEAIVAFFIDCNETYYLRKHECLGTATAIVRQALRRPAWLPRILAEIYRRSDLLTGVFDPQISATSLRSFSDGRLLTLFRRHAGRQRSLYRVARLPEALDRGVGYFSGYLREHLRSLGVPASEVGDAFATLSQPLVPSVLAQEILEFDQIVRGVRASPETAEQIASHGRRAHLFLDPAVLDQLDAHREKWQFLHYHGYGRRELATLRQYLDHLIEQLRQPPAQAAARLLQRLHEGHEARQRLLDRLNLDRSHRRLFEVYPEIGAAKLYRRLAQLRNFYYLDLLLAESARRLGVAEWVVRGMLPEELTSILQSRRHVPPAIAERVGACMLALFDESEHVRGGDAAAAMARLFQEKTHRPARDTLLTGVVASQGKVTGPCKVIIRADDVHDDFAKGTIIVSESTDPDLLGFLERAGGVLTEQGGVTSHAAIICRELGIPTIIGIEGLLEQVHDGDVVEVDAFRGTVTRVASGPVPKAYAVPEAGPAVLGAKAENLAVVRSLGFNVPEFVVLPLETVRGFLDQSIEPDGAVSLQGVVARLGMAPGDKVAIRSSSVNEDGADGSLAGEYRSLLHVPGDRVAEALREFVRSNDVGKRGNAYDGSLILQRMIAADYAGVCLTLDPRTGHGNAVILEIVAGDNDALTSGTVVPDRWVVDRLTGDILEAERPGTGLREAGIDVAALVQQFLTLEATFGQPLDIEWAWANRQLYILQARPISSGNGRAVVELPQSVR
jgi:phosphohistidine swiveling domain-containing protein